MLKSVASVTVSLIARLIGPTWGPPGTDRTQVGPHVGHMNFAIWVVTSVTNIIATRIYKIASAILKNKNCVCFTKGFKSLMANHVISTGPKTELINNKVYTTVAWYRYSTPSYSTWPSSFSSHILIGEESDGGHKIKRALYIGIKRLWFTQKWLVSNFDW